MGQPLRVVFENGVFRPLEPVDLDEQQELTITLPESLFAQSALRPDGEASVWDEIDDILATVPEEELAALPRDGAEKPRSLSLWRTQRGMSRAVFTDTFFWIARINPRDRYHQAAVKLSKSLLPCIFITSEDVLVETLIYFSKHGPFMRRSTAQSVRRLQASDTIRIFPQSNVLFEAGLALYESRIDKGYSLTDCISMAAMRKEDLTEVLTNDHHFEQEGFRCLF